MGLAQLTGVSVKQDVKLKKLLTMCEGPRVAK